MKARNLIAALAVALALFPSAAAAEDAFYFENETGIGFAGTMPPPEDGCWFGMTGLFVSGPGASQEGSLRSQIDLFSDCEEEFWDPFLAYNQTPAGSYTEEGFTKYLFSGGVGAISFLASDPRVGSATLSCETNGASWEEGNGYTPIEPYMTVEVDETTCTVDWVPGMAGTGARVSATGAKRPAGSHLRLVDSLARVVGDEAQVRAQAFGAGERDVRARVRLTTLNGRPLGRTRGWLRTGAEARVLAVPLPPSARRALAGKRRELTVRATLTHAEGSAGSGDTTRRLILR